MFRKNSFCKKFSEVTTSATDFTTLFRKLTTYDKIFEVSRVIETLPTDSAKVISDVTSVEDQDINNDTSDNYETEPPKKKAIKRIWKMTLLQML